MILRPAGRNHIAAIDVVGGGVAPSFSDVRLMATTTCVLLMLTLVHPAWSHGRLVDPPSRSSMWRYGFKSPPNYNDMELFCGGFTRQWMRNGGKCGICGDPWDAADPKANEMGGKYAGGIAGVPAVVRVYSTGGEMVASVQLTANHNGHFEFRVCQYDTFDSRTEVTQECLDSHQVELQDGSGTKFQVPIGSGSGTFQVPLRLPADVSCERCLFQWIYKAANNWGRCDDGSGTSRVGCGPQEQFRACADIRIVGDAAATSPASNDDGILARPSRQHDDQSSVLTGDTAAVTTAPENDPWRPAFTYLEESTTTTTTARPTTSPVRRWPDESRPRGRNCSGAGVWAGQAGMRDWCLANCNHTPPYCPSSHCICEDAVS